MPARMIIAMLVALSLLTAFTQDLSWKEYNDAGEEAHEQGRYDEAKELFLAALEEAEKFEDQDIRLATTLNELAYLYFTQGEYTEAEPLYQRALSIYEKAWGPEHPDVAMTLENYAALLREMDRNAEAEKLEERARAIRGEE